MDLVILMLGTNDLVMADLPLIVLGAKNITRATLNAEMLIPFAGKIFSSQPKVLLIAPPALGKCVDTMNDTPYCGKYKASLLFSKAYKRVADELGVEYLDANEYAVISEADGVHMTAEGHKRLGFAIADKIKLIFGKEIISM